MIPPGSSTPHQAGIAVTIGSEAGALCNSAQMSPNEAGQCTPIRKVKICSAQSKFSEGKLKMAFLNEAGQGSLVSMTADGHPRLKKFCRYSFSAVVLHFVHWDI